MIGTEFNYLQLDALREISSIAVGSAATSLSIMVGRKVDISVPDIVVEALDRVPEILGGEEKISNVLYFSLSGQITGSILLIFSISDSLKLVNILTGQKLSQQKDMDEMGRSALKELGNIIIGSYLRSMGQVLKMRISYSIPGFTTDMLGAVLDGSLAGLSLDAGHALIMKNEFIVEEVVHGGHLIFIPEHKTLNVMLRALEMSGIQRSDFLRSGNA